MISVRMIFTGVTISTMIFTGGDHEVTMRMRRRAVTVVKDTDSGEGKQVPFVNIILKPTEEVPHSAVASLVFQQH